MKTRSKDTTSASYVGGTPVSNKPAMRTARDLGSTTGLNGQQQVKKERQRAISPMPTPMPMPMPTPQIPNFGSAPQLFQSPPVVHEPPRYQSMPDLQTAQPWVPSFPQAQAYPPAHNQPMQSWHAQQQPPYPYQTPAQPPLYPQAHPSHQYQMPTAQSPYSQVHSPVHSQVHSQAHSQAHAQVQPSYPHHVPTPQPMYPQAYHASPLQPQAQTQYTNLNPPPLPKRPTGSTTGSGYPVGQAPDRNFPIEAHYKIKPGIMRDVPIGEINGFPLKLDLTARDIALYKHEVGNDPARLTLSEYIDYRQVQEQMAQQAAGLNSTIQPDLSIKIGQHDCSLTQLHELSFDGQQRHQIQFAPLAEASFQKMAKLSKPRVQR